MQIGPSIAAEHRLHACIKEHMRKKEVQASIGWHNLRVGPSAPGLGLACLKMQVLEGRPMLIEWCLTAWLRICHITTRACFEEAVRVGTSNITARSWSIHWTSAGYPSSWTLSWWT